MANVPRVPGVPTLSSYASGVGSLLVADALGVLRSLFNPLWGIFKSGLPVITAENVVSFEYRQEWAISNYPLEKGAFESYNKVNSPFESRVRFSSGGSLEARQAMLKSIDVATNSLDLFDVVTPDAVYLSVNLSHYDYQRQHDRGVGLLVVDVWCQQIRVTAQTAFSSTKSPSGAGTSNVGTVQPSALSPAQTMAVSAGVQ